MHPPRLRKRKPNDDSMQTVVVLDADVAELFPTSAEVNDALRTLAAIIKRHPSRSAKEHTRAGSIPCRAD